MEEENKFIEQLRELLAKDLVYRKSVETALFKSEEKYRLLLDQLADAIYFSTVDGRFIEFNKATCTLLGYSEEELRKLQVEDIYSKPDERKKFTQILRDNQEIQDYEIQLRKKNGELIDCLVTSTVRKNENGQVTGYQGIIRDITLRKKATALQRAKELAEQANKFKAEFLANMSHEIRTPLNAITGMVHLLHQTPLTEKQKDYLHAIDTSGENLLQIINDILDFSKIEAGKLQLEEKYFSVREIIDDLINTIRFKADQKNLQLTVDIDKNIPQQISGDPLRLNQILLNLVSNAIKFTHEGAIRVFVKLIDIHDDKARIFFSVKDTGVGIVQDKLTNIFDSFTQASADTTRVYGGTGLGLAIVKKLIDMLGGAIMVKSRIGEGSEFLFELEFKVGKESHVIKQKEKTEEIFIDIGTCRILLVDDHPLNQIVTTEMLKNKWHSAHIEIAENGKIAIEKVISGGFDIILMDVQMPEMDGHTATRIIRKNMQPPISETPILAFTAYATTGEADKCIEAGMDDYISKPVDFISLTTKIISLLRKKNYFKNLEGKIPGQKLESAPIHAEVRDIQFNLEYFHTITEQDKDLKVRMLRIMLDETPDEVKKLQKFINEENWDNLRAIAHKMKSSMQFLGMKKTLDTVKFIELSAKERTNLSQLSEKVSSVAKDCEQALHELREELSKIQ
ncbi:MAG: ATP-binding protein [Chitinophagales bacterium]